MAGAAAQRPAGFLRAASQGGNRLSHIYRQAFGQGITYEHDLANRMTLRDDLEQEYDP